MNAIQNLKVLIMTTGTLFMFGCGNIDITPMELPVAPLDKIVPTAKFCTPAPGNQSNETRILFVVDKSGSNDNSDPGGNRRYGAIQNFFNKHSDKEKIKWGLIEFQEETAKSSFTSPFFRGASEFSSAISTSQSGIDDGWTPYLAAITLIGQALRNELLSANSEVTTNFEIVFISDGVPTDYGKTIIDDGRIMEDVRQLVRISIGHVRMSTVYYNLRSTADEDASNRLESMSQVGNGKFQDASDGQELNFDDLINVGNEMYAYQVKDFFVYNLNTTLCDDGSIDSDSDTDGLCDKDEDRYNEILSARISANPALAGKKFNKSKRNSFTLHYSDIFIYRQLMGETLPQCSDADAAKDPDKDLLNNCEEKFLTNYSPAGPNQRWTDEMSLASKNSSSTNFDSDGDGILDALEFYFFKEKGLALDYFSIYKNFYGNSQYELFKNHLSKTNPAGSDPYQIDLKHVERTLDGSNCYSFKQEVLPLYAATALSYTGAGNINLTHATNENVVLVYYILVPENDPTSKGILMQSYQRIQSGGGVENIDLSIGRFTRVTGI